MEKENQRGKPADPDAAGKWQLVLQQCVLENDVLKLVNYFVRIPVIFPHTDHYCVYFHPPRGMGTLHTVW